MTSDRRITDGRAEAKLLGLALAELTEDPEAFVAELRAGLVRLSDADYASELARVQGGSGPSLAVRSPLLRAIRRPLEHALAEASTSSALWLAQRLDRADQREVRLFAVTCLRRSLGGDPERSWQEMRRLARRADGWIEVDAQADLWVRGVLAEPFRWAELEQLVYSSRATERRLVASSLARLPHALPRRARGDLRGAATGRALALIATLMGDDQGLVQTALSWALREWAAVDQAMVADLLRDQAAICVDHRDGHRAWVIRDALTAQPEAVATELRARLSGIRRRQGAPATSSASRMAAAYASMAALADAATATQGERFARSSI